MYWNAINGSHAHVFFRCEGHLTCRDPLLLICRRLCEPTRAISPPHWLEERFFLLFFLCSPYSLSLTNRQVAHKIDLEYFSCSRSLDGCNVLLQHPYGPVITDYPLQPDYRPTVKPIFPVHSRFQCGYDGDGVGSNYMCEHTQYTGQYQCSDSVTQALLSHQWLKWTCLNIQFYITAKYYHKFILSKLPLCLNASLCL